MNALIRWPLLAGAGAAACFLTQLPLHANGFTQHGVHEHGSVEINIAAESRKLSLENGVISGFRAGIPAPILI
jgi:hypothetical protein